jgi:hypothetical protein
MFYYIITVYMKIIVALEQRLQNHRLRSCETGILEHLLPKLSVVLSPFFSGATSNDAYNYSFSPLADC